jgi:hypothetical protein
MSSNPEPTEILRTLAEKVSGLGIQMVQVLGDLEDFRRQQRILAQRVDAIEQKMKATEEDPDQQPS